MIQSSTQDLAPDSAVSSRLADERLELALEAGRMGTWQIDVDSGSLTCSDTCKANFGRSPDESLTYDDWAASVIEADRARWHDVVTEALSTGAAFEMEHGVIWADGSAHWVFVRGGCHSDENGRVDTMLGVSVDITQQHLAREELRDAQTRLEATLAAGEVATWIWNVVDDRVVADRNLARFFGVSAADARGGALSSYIDAMHPDDREHIAELIQAALRNGGRYEAKYRVRDAEGIYRTIVARGQAEYSANGKPLRLPGVVIDVTRQEELLATTRAAHAESEAKRRKLASEVRAALTPITIALESLKQRVHSVSVEERAVIDQQVAHITRLLDASVGEQ